MRPVFFIISLGTAILAAPACFNPPADPVQFSCEPGDEAECPAEYECRDDGCCHREDSPDGSADGGCHISAASASGPSVARAHSGDPVDSADAPSDVSAPEFTATTTSAGPAPAADAN